MRSRSESLEFALLGLLSQTPLHGYELRKRMGTIFGPFRALSFSVLYPQLRRMMEAGLIEETVVDYKSCVRIMESDSEKKIETKLKNKFVSASIFQNGKVLLSAVDETVQKKYYEWFVDLMKDLESDVKQCTVPKKTFLRR